MLILEFMLVLMNPIEYRLVIKLKYIGVTDDAYVWFQKKRTIKDEKGKVIGKFSENELLTRLLNMTEHYNIKFDRSDD